MKLYAGLIAGYPDEETFYLTIKRIGIVNHKWLFRYIATNGCSYLSEPESLETDSSDYMNAAKQILTNINPSKELIDSVCEIVL